MRMRAVAALLTLPGFLALGGPATLSGARADSSGAQQLASAMSADQARMATAARSTARLKALPTPASPIDRLRRDM